MQIIHLKALMGDKSDNIPGVAGVGEKSAYSLLSQYKDLDGVYAHIDDIKGALGQKLRDNKDTAFMSLSLATINTNAPIEVSLHDCVLKTPFSLALKEKFAELEFRSLLTQDIYESEAGQTPMTLNEPAILSVTLKSVKEGLDKIQDESLPIAIHFDAQEARFYLVEADRGVLQERTERYSKGAR